MTTISQIKPSSPMIDQISLIVIAAILFCVLWTSCAIACRWSRNANPIAFAFLTTILLAGFIGIGLFLIPTP